MKKIKKFFLETYGCQMNFNDSELVDALLSKGGLTPAKDASEADLILVNTCGIRDHAEQRVFGRLGHLKTYKDNAPHMLLGVIGCMAQRTGAKILENAPWVDLVVGPDGYRRIPEMINELSGGQDTQLAELSLNIEETYDDILPTRRKDLWSAWVTVSRGCDKFCSFCIVPYVRGRERSINPDVIERQVKEYTANGALEIVLLGQNINSYSHGNTDFAALLRRIGGLDEVRWLRFLTSHPFDLDDGIIEAIAENDKICEHFHLPVQSGSDRVLEQMRRKYTHDEYLERVGRLREKMPNISMTTDIMVGFPGETEEDHQETLRLMKEVRFDYAYTFKYSERPGTLAARSKDMISEEEKGRRLEETISLQRIHTREALRKLRGKTLEILPCGTAKSNDGKLLAKTRTHFSLFVEAEENRIGKITQAKVTGDTGMSLIGELSDTKKIPADSPGPDMDHSQDQPRDKQHAII